MAEHEDLRQNLPSEQELLGRQGRPPAITREVADELLELIESGYTITQACALQGIGRSTFTRYVAQYRAFRVALTRARRSRALEAARNHKEAIQVAVATGDWRASQVRYESEIRQLEREIAQGTWSIRIDEGLLDYIAAEVRRRLRPGVPEHDVLAALSAEETEAGKAHDSAKTKKDVSR